MSHVRDSALHCELWIGALQHAKEQVEGSGTALASPDTAPIVAMGAAPNPPREGERVQLAKGA